MSYYTSLSGKVHLTKTAWDRVKDLIVPYLGEPLYKAMGNSENQETEAVWDQGGVRIDMYGSNLPLSEILDILCSVKTIRKVDTLYGTDHEETSQFTIHMWPGGWTEDNYVPMPPPSMRIRAQVARRTFVEGVGISRGNGTSYIPCRRADIPPPPPEPLSINKGRVRGTILTP